MLAEALEHLVRGVVDNPDDVTVRDKQLRRGSILEVRVHPDDLGKVIGRGGRTATAFRTVDLGAGRPGRRADRLRRRRPPPLSRMDPLHGRRPVRARHPASEDWAVETRGRGGPDRQAPRHPGRGDVEVRTDEPGAPVRATAPCCGPSRRGVRRRRCGRSPSPAPAGTGATLLVTFEELARPQRRRGGPRDPAARHRRRRRVARGPRRVLRPPAGRPRGVRREGTHLGEVTGLVARRRPGPARPCGHPTAARRWCRS